MFRDREYPSDLTDEQWRLVKRMLPKPKSTGRKPIDRRWVVDAILYVTVTGCQWRQLPHDFPKWKTVYNTFWAWRRDGVLQRVHDAFREKLRKGAGKKSTPTVAILAGFGTLDVAERRR